MNLNFKPTFDPKYLRIVVEVTTVAAALLLYLVDRNSQRLLYQAELQNMKRELKEIIHSKILVPTNPISTESVINPVAPFIDAETAKILTEYAVYYLIGVGIIVLVFCGVQVIINHYNVNSEAIICSSPSSPSGSVAGDFVSDVITNSIQVAEVATQTYPDAGLTAKIISKIPENLEFLNIIFNDPGTTEPLRRVLYAVAQNLVGK